jgi:hypothetical protein
MQTVHFVVIFLCIGGFLLTIRATKVTVLLAIEVAQSNYFSITKYILIEKRNICSSVNELPLANSVELRTLYYITMN